MVAALNLDWQSIPHMIIYMFQCYSLKSSHPRLLPQSPTVLGRGDKDVHGSLPQLGERIWVESCKLEEEQSIKCCMDQKLRTQIKESILSLDGYTNGWSLGSGRGCWLGDGQRWIPSHGSLYTLVFKEVLVFVFSEGARERSGSRIVSPSVENECYSIN